MPPRATASSRPPRGTRSRPEATAANRAWTRTSALQRRRPKPRFLTTAPQGHALRRSMRGKGTTRFEQHGEQEAGCRSRGTAKLNGPRWPTTVRSRGEYPRRTGGQARGARPPTPRECASTNTFRSQSARRWIADRRQSAHSGPRRVGRLPDRGRASTRPQPLGTNAPPLAPTGSPVLRSWPGQ